MIFKVTNLIKSVHTMRSIIENNKQTFDSYIQKNGVL